MSKNKKILLGLLMIFLIGITWVLFGDSKREYVGKITTEELDMIRNEVIKELPETETASAKSAAGGQNMTPVYEEITESATDEIAAE